MVSLVPCAEPGITVCGLPGPFIGDLDSQGPAESMLRSPSDGDPPRRACEPDAVGTARSGVWSAVMTGAKVDGVDATPNDQWVDDANVAVGGDIDTNSAPGAKLLREACSATHGVLAHREYQPLITIQQGEHEDLTVFCMPGAGDNVVSFLPLANELGPMWTVYGLQPRGLDGEMAPYTDVQTAAEAYLRGIDAARLDASTPLHLIGHSFGGWVAFETALRLHAHGRSIASLTILDSDAPHGDGIPGFPYTSTDVLNRLIVALENSTGKSLDVSVRSLEQADEKGKRQLVHEGMKRVGLMPKGSKAEDIAGLVCTFGAALRTTYCPERVYHGLVRLVWAADDALDDLANMRAQLKTSAQWRRFAPALTSWCSPGNHYTMLRQPNVATLVDWWTGRR